MAGATTIPSIAGGSTFTQITISWIDDNGKEFSDALRTKGALTDPEIQAFADDNQAGSNASSWRLETAIVYEGAKSKANAASNVHESIADKIRYSLKDVATGAYAQTYLPAPLAALVDDENIIVTTDQLYIDWKAAVDAVKQANLTPLNVEYVQYHQRNATTSP